MSAIAFIHKVNAAKDPTSQPLIVTSLKGLKNTSIPNEDRRRPITRTLLHKLIDTVHLVTSCRYTRKMLKALYLFSFYCCLRAGEAVSSKEKAHSIKFGNIATVKSPELKYSIKLDTFKHSESKTITLILNPSGNEKYCPVSALKNYITVRGNVNGNLFLDTSAKPITLHQFSIYLKKNLEHAGLDSTYYNTHSFRSGRVTQLAMDNATVEVIKNTGRWKTSAYSSYIKQSTFHLPA